MQQDSNPYTDITLAILAGGEGSRMGIPKGELRIDGQPILQYLLQRFEWPGPTLLVTAPGRDHPPGWEWFTQEAADPVAGLGPLRGVLTALEHAGTDHVLVTPVDMPGLAAGQLRWLVSAFRTEWSHRGGVCGLMTSRESGQGTDHGSTDGSVSRVEPFPAVFNRDAAVPIRTRLEAGRGSVHGLSDDPHMIVVPAPEHWGGGTWLNMNRPDDWHAFLQERSAAGPRPAGAAGAGDESGAALRSLHSLHLPRRGGNPGI